MIYVIKERLKGEIMMNTCYNYIEEMTQDIKEYIKYEVVLSDFSDRD